MDIQTFLTNIGAFLNSTVLPFMIAIAFITFLWNAFRYFIVGGADPSEQQKARNLAFWGIGAFVVILSLWGIVYMLVGGFGLGTRYGTTPDYLCVNGWNGCTSGRN